MATTSSAAASATADNSKRNWRIAVIAVAVLLGGLGLWYLFGPQPATATTPTAEPIKTVKQKIWAGYYKAEVNERYNSRMADLYDDLAKWSTRVLAGVAIALLATSGFMANAKVTKRTKVWLFAIESVVAIVSVTAALWNFEGAADTHRKVAIAWRGLAAEWDKAREARATASDEELSELHRTLVKKEDTIEDEIEPPGYWRWYFRRTQRDYNRYLGING